MEGCSFIINHSSWDVNHSHLFDPYYAILHDQLRINNIVLHERLLQAKNKVTILVKNGLRFSYPLGYNNLAMQGVVGGLCIWLYLTNSSRR